MKLFVAALAMAMAASVSASTVSASDQYAFEQFKVDYGRKYESEEENAKRLQIFVKNLAIAESRNEAERSAGGSAIHGITRFSDLHPDEFKSMFLSSDVSMKGSLADRDVALDLPEYDSSSEVDWSGVYTTPVKNQRQCGSCWAFSATEQLESDIMR